MCTQIFFEVQPNNVFTHVRPNSAKIDELKMRPQSFRFLYVGHLKPLVYLGPIENEETRDQPIFMPVKRHSVYVSNLRYKSTKCRVSYGLCYRILRNC
jgi:hypothetical protein